MKRFIYIICTVVLFSLTSCSSEEPDSGGSGSVSPDKTVVSMLKSVVTNWGCSPEEVSQSMKGYTRSTISATEDVYTSNNNSHSIIYQYYNEELVAAVIALPLQDENLSLDGTLGMTLMGERYGTKIYKYTDKSFVAQFDVESEAEVTLVGFSSITGGDFPEYETIEVQTGEATEIGIDNACLYTTVKGGVTVDKCLIEYALSPDMKDCKSAAARTESDGRFSLKIANLTINSTYYYRGKAYVDDIIYYGDIRSFNTLEAVTYSVGDPYPDAVNPEGIVWKVDEQGIHGTMISLVHDYLKWDVNSLFCTDYGYNKNDGTQNTLPTNQPFGHWIHGLGTGWYGPALNELLSLSKVTDSVNTGLRSVGADALKGFYWSSTQYSNNHAYFVCISSNGYMGYNNGYSAWVSKNNSESCIGMKRF